MINYDKLNDDLLLDRQTGLQQINHPYGGSGKSQQVLREG